MSKKKDPDYVPYAEKRHPKPSVMAQVRSLSATGVKQANIAKLLKIGLDTLHKHYADDVKIGKEVTDALVSQKLINAALKGEPWAVRFYLERKAGWHERQEMDLKSPIEVTGEAALIEKIIAKATPEERKHVANAIKRAI